MTSYKDPRSIAIRDYTYTLPDERIAKYPLAERDSSKLLVYQSGNITDDHFFNLPDRLNEGDLVVFNETKVIHARLIFRKATGSTIEILCLEPNDIPEPAVALQQIGKCEWKVMIGNRKRWKESFQEMLINAGEKNFRLKAEIVGDENTSAVVRFSWDAAISFAEVIELAGKIPLPPYFDREPEREDEERYQTVYAKYEGSVAAPTAGLHFTARVLDALLSKNINLSYVTLHVGAGTFRPVKAEVMAGHDMHEERIVVSAGMIEKLIDVFRQRKSSGKKIVAVGTTSMRTLESLYWLGVKLHLQHDENKNLALEQWFPYENHECELSQEVALRALLNHLNKNNLQNLIATTGILIAPGYEFKIVDTLITNFHQPDSTLLLLVAAFVGEDWRKIYDHALANNYRFLSYGDSSLLLRN